MKRLTVATTLVAVAFAVTVPVVLAQATSGADTAQSAATPRGNEVGPGVMYGQGQAQAGNQGGNAPDKTYGPGQGTYGSHMMGGYGFGWMGGYSGIWVLSLLAIVGAGLVAWVVKKKGT